MTPILRVVSGSPTAEELAIVAAVVSAAGGGAAEEAATNEPVRGRWNDPAWQHRRQSLSGPGGWRAAAR